MVSSGKTALMGNENQVNASAEVEDAAKDQYFSFKNL